MVNRAGTKSQSERFKEAARELECDEDEDSFNATLKKVAKRSAKMPDRVKKPQKG